MFRYFDWDEDGRISEQDMFNVMKKMDEWAKGYEEDDAPSDKMISDFLTIQA